MSRREIRVQIVHNLPFKHHRDYIHRIVVRVQILLYNHGVTALIIRFITISVFKLHSPVYGHIPIYLQKEKKKLQPAGSNLLCSWEYTKGITVNVCFTSGESLVMQGLLIRRSCCADTADIKKMMKWITNFRIIVASRWFKIQELCADSNFISAWVFILL